MPAGITGTVGTTSTFDRPYKVLSGSPMGVVAIGALPTANDQVVPASTVLLDQDIYLPTDQHLTFVCYQTLYGQAGAGLMHWVIDCDDTLVQRVPLTAGVGAASGAQSAQIYHYVQAGRHRVRVTLAHAGGSAVSAINGSGIGPTRVWVQSAGGAQ